MSTWILLRGLTRETRHWGDFIDAFKAALPDVQIAGIDFPGNGRFHRHASPTSVTAMVEFCRAELKQQQVLPPYALLAISLGGMVAVEWAARYPQEIDACVLINTSMQPFSTLTQRLRPHNYSTLLRLLLTPLSTVQLETRVLRMTTNHAASQKQLDNWVRYRNEHPVSRLNALRQLAAAGRYTAPNKSPACRLLILASSHDGLVDPQCSRQLATAWRAPLIEHHTAGHDLTVDDGEWTAQTIARWWRESHSSA